jgi:hypothetical protein
LVETVGFHFLKSDSPPIGDLGVGGDKVTQVKGLAGVHKIISSWHTIPVGGGAGARFSVYKLAALDGSVMRTG